MGKKYTDEDWLYEKYHCNEMSQKEISEMCECSRKTIGRWMDKFDINTRSIDSATSISQSSCSGNHRDSSWLKEKYIDDERSLMKISEMCGCTGETIRTWLEKYEIPRRGNSERVELECDGKHKDKQWLKDNYTDCGSIYDVSDRCGCSPATVNKWLHKFNIEIRGKEADCSKKHLDKAWLEESFSKNQKSIQEIAKQCGCSSTVIRRQLVEFDLSRDDIQPDCSMKHRDKSWIVEKYEDSGLTMKEISDECGCSQTCISRWIRKYDIEPSSGKFSSGDEHWNYKDGSSISDKLDFRKSDRWIELSINKKKEANWECEYCSNSGNLHTHHTHPVSMGGKKWDNDFIVLCKDCHIGNYKRWHPPQLEEYICQHDVTAKVPESKFTFSS